MTRKYNRGPSEAQSNAEAIARRSTPYTEAHRGSVSLQWDWQKRDPRDLRDAVRMCRRAYQDEVPSKLHEGTGLADDGTPRFTSQAEGYIFGSATRTDAGPMDSSDRPFLTYYQTPFRASLATMERGSEPEAKRAAIVRHVTLGSQGPQEAAIAEGVPVWCAKTVAEDALRSFLRRLSDVRVDVAKVTTAA